MLSHKIRFRLLVGQRRSKKGDKRILLSLPTFYVLGNSSYQVLVPSLLLLFPSWICRVG